MIIGMLLGLLVVGGGFLFESMQRKKIKEAVTRKEKFEMYDKLFQKYSVGYPWRWLKAIAKQESDLGEDSSVKKGLVSFDGLSFGLMQIAEGVGSRNEILIKGRGGKEKLNDPVYSIKKAADLVSYLNGKYRGDQDKVFLAYNQGEKNTDRGKDFTTKFSSNGISYKVKINRWLEWIADKEKELA